jgi:WD40 repeat protein
MATAETTAPHDERSPPGAVLYDGFISYSHAADDLLAPRLQAALQRFAKPWWKRRAVRIFRDESSLSANPHLWSSISDSLDRSAWFVLLLSPEAAESPWVENEVEYWLAHKDPGRIIPVLTGGHFAWGDDGIVSDAAPPALRRAFDDEPRWVDLRFARTEEQLDLSNPTFSAAVADIASAIRGVPKDELESEEVRQHRRTTRTAWGAAIALVLLGLTALVAAAVAVGQSNEAQTQRDEAELQAGIAVENEQRANDEADRASRLADEAQLQAELARSRELAASAINVLDVDPELSLLLSLTAADVADPTFESVTALHEALMNHRTRLAMPPLVEAAVQDREGSALSPDGSVMARSADNTVLLIDTATGVPRWSYEWAEGLLVSSPTTAGSPMLFTPDGASLVVAAVSADRAVPEPNIGEGVYVFDTATGSVRLMEFDWPCPVIRLVGSGEGTIRLNTPFVAIAAKPTGDASSPCSFDGAQAVVFDPDGSGTVLIPDLPRVDTVMSSSGNGDFVVAALPGSTEVIDVASGAAIFSAPEIGGFVATLDDTGARLLTAGGLEDASVTVWDVAAGAPITNFDRHEGFAVGQGFFLGDGTVVLTTGIDGTLRVWDAATSAELVVLRGAASAIFGAGVTADGNRAMSLAADGVRLWNLGGNGETGAADLPWTRNIATGASIAGRAGVSTKLLEGGNAFAAYHFDLDTGIVERRIENDLTGQTIALSPDDRRLAAQVALGEATGPIRVFDTATGAPLFDLDGLCTWTQTPAGEPTGPDCVPLPAMPFAELVWNLEFAPDASRLAAGGYSSSATVWDAETGAVEWNSGAAPNGSPVTVAFHPGGTLFGYADANITIVDTADYVEVASRPAETFLRVMRFTADGDYLVTATQDSNIVWYRSDDLEEAGRIDGAHEGFVKDLDVTSGGQIVSSGSDGFVRVWDIESGELVQAIPFDDEVQNVEVLDDGDIFVTPLTGPGVVVTTDVDTLIDVARNRLTRSFTETECATYHIDPCPTLEQLGGSS